MSGLVQDGGKVIDFALSIIMSAFRLANPPKIRQPNGVAQSMERPTEGLNHFIVAVTAKKRMGVGHDCDARAGRRCLIDRTVNPAGRAGHRDPARAWRHPSTRSRSTTLPWRRCESMISSTSCWSTKVYQTASG